MADWYALTAKAGDEVADLSIFGEIGGGWFADEDAVTGKRFAQQLEALPDSVRTIKVRVNSPGGAVFDAVHIANALRRQSREKGRIVEMEVEALAASAATLITSAGDAIRIPRNAVMMIHMPSGLALGSAGAMRKMADALDRITDSIIATYRWVSALAPERLREMMAATTWMSAEEAVEHGFATEVIEGVEAAARITPDDVRMLGALPPALAPLLLPAPAASAAPAAPDPKAVVAACERYSPKLAAALIGLPQAEVDARLAHAQEVTHLCTIRGLAELAEGYILAQTPVAIVRQHVTVIAGREDRLRVTESHPASPRDGTPAAPTPVRISARDIFEQRNSRALVGARRS